MSPSPEVLQSPQPKEWFDDDNNDSSSSDGDDIIDFLHPAEPASVEPKRDESTKRHLTPVALRSLSTSPLPALAPLSRQRTWRSRVQRVLTPFWERNRGMILVASSQMFGSLMNLTARLLEIEGDGMHPFQILFARMSLTTLFSCVYMYKVGVPGFPFGPPELRWLLIARGISGFFGIYGMWYSMMYLPLAEATVISFLAPSVSGFICHILIHDPYTRKEQIASLLAMVGVVFIARPASLFSSSATAGGATTAAAEAVVDIAANMTASPQQQLSEEPTQAQRLSAIGVALLGVMGASGAFTTIRWIGKRAHPLISVNYFSTWCTLVSTIVLLLAPVLNIGQPQIHFAMPASLRQWMLLFVLGTCGMIMQFMLTAGLAGEKSNRATAMVYTQMLFAAGFDKWVFGHEMGALSLIGCGFIVGSALWVALTKKEQDKARPGADVEARAGGTMEGEPMLRDMDRGEDDESEGIALAQVR